MSTQSTELKDITPFQTITGDEVIPALSKDGATAGTLTPNQAAKLISKNADVLANPDPSMNVNLSDKDGAQHKTTIAQLASVVSGNGIYYDITWKSHFLKINSNTNGLLFIFGVTSNNIHIAVIASQSYGKTIPCVINLSSKNIVIKAISKDNYLYVETTPMSLTLLRLGNLQASDIAVDTITDADIPTDGTVII